MNLQLKLLAMLLCTAAVIAACGDETDAVPTDGEAVEETTAAAPDTTEAATDTTVADTEAPPDTEAPVDDGEAPAEDEAPAGDEADDDAAGDDEGGDNSTRNILIIAVAAALIAGVAFFMARSGRSGGSGRGQAASQPARAPTMHVDDRVLGDISWFNEQLSLDLLAAPPEQAVERWRAERPRIEALTRDCQRLEESTADPMWGALAGEVASLAQTLDTATMARAGNQVDPAVTRQSIDQVNRHRSQLSGLAIQARRR